MWWSNLYKLKPQICIVMHVYGHYILVYKYKETNRVYSVTDSVVRIAAHKMRLGAFPCDNLTAKRCIFICVYVCVTKKTSVLYLAGRNSSQKLV